MELELRDAIIETRADVKHLVEWAKSHQVEDDNRHKEISEKIGFHQKIVYGGIGIIVAIQFIGHLIK